MFLERQIQHVEDLVSGFEKKLVEDGTILNKPSALENRKQEIQVVQQNGTNISFFYITTVSYFFLTLSKRMYKRRFSQQRTSW